MIALWRGVVLVLGKLDRGRYRSQAETNNVSTAASALVRAARPRVAARMARTAIIAKTSCAIVSINHEVRVEEVGRGAGLG